LWLRHYNHEVLRLLSVQPVQVMGLWLAFCHIIQLRTHGLSTMVKMHRSGMALPLWDKPAQAVHHAALKSRDCSAVIQVDHHPTSDYCVRVAWQFVVRALWAEQAMVIDTLEDLSK